MFLSLFHSLKEAGIPVSLKGLLSLEKALSLGTVASLEDLYVVARGVLVKSERHFDLYDRLFCRHFRGAEEELSSEMETEMELLLEEWLKERKDILGAVPDGKELSPAELEAYFAARLKDQKEQHDGGSRWIGTAGASPVGWGGAICRGCGSWAVPPNFRP